MALGKKIENHHRMIQRQKRHESYLLHVVDYFRAIEKTMSSPSDLKMSQIPDLTPLTRLKAPKSDWDQWTAIGEVEGYKVSLTHLMMGSMVVISKGEQDILVYSDDKAQRPNTGIGHQVKVISSEDELIKIINLLMGLKMTKKLESSFSSKIRDFVKNQSA